MPIPEQRDAERTRSQLSTWLAPRVGARGPVEVGELRGPGATGFSNETLIADCRWEGARGPDSSTLVVRVAPTGYSLFPDASFDAQYRVLVALGTRSDLPVPTVRWYEGDSAVLGAPFFVMEEVRGRVPPDNPPYHVAGWLHDVDPAHRERVWWGGVDTIAQVHGLDWRALGLDFLGEAEPEVTYYSRWLDALEEVEPVPTARRAQQWVLAHLPEAEEKVLCWGDARIGNVMFDEQGHRLAVLDWEMVGLGAPEKDVAWALFLDRHHSEGCGVPRLDGFPTAAATVARYEAATGRRLRHLEFYEVFAGFRFCVIMARLAGIFKEWGLLPPDDPMAQDNTVSRLTETVLAERGD